MHEKQFSNRRYCKDHPNVEGVTVGLLVFWTTFALCNHQHWDDVCNIVYLKIFCPTVIFCDFLQGFFKIKSIEHWRPDPGDPPKRGVQKYLRPGPASIPFSNRRYSFFFPEVPITSPKKGKSRFQIEDIGIIFQKSPKKTRKSRFQMRFPSQAQKKTRKFRFQIEDIGIIFQMFPSQAQKKEIPFSNRRYWHYISEKPKKTRKSRFQMRFPSQAQKKTRKFRFQIEDVGILFSSGCHHKPKTTRKILVFK